MIPPHIDAIFNEYLGKRNLAIADLQLFLHSPAGVGDHQNFGASVKSKIEEIERFDSLVKIIIELYPEVNKAPKPEPVTPKPESGKVKVSSTSKASTSKTDLYKDGSLLGKFQSQDNPSD